MRELSDHKSNALNETIAIKVVDEPGAGGAHHQYLVDLGVDPPAPGNRYWRIDFQKGPLGEAGPNGLTQEVLLAIVIDRLRSFQAGPYACPENADALTHAVEALAALKSRTAKRVDRGVEGTMAA